MRQYPTKYVLLECDTEVSTDRLDQTELPQSNLPVISQHSLRHKPTRRISQLETGDRVEL